MFMCVELPAAHTFTQSFIKKEVVGDHKITLKFESARELKARERE